MASVFDKTAKSEKLAELNYFRFIACIAVMLIHISAIGVTDYIYGSIPQILMVVFNSFIKFATPAFVFLSGITNFYGIRGGRINSFKFVSKRLKKTLIPYFAWCMVYFLAYAYKGIYALDPIFLIKGILFGNLTYHLYFVVIIAQFYVLGPALYSLMKNSDRKILIVLIAAVITGLGNEYLHFLMSDRFFIKYLFFYMLGIYAALEYDKFKSFVIRYRIILALLFIAFGLNLAAGFYGIGPVKFSPWYLFSSVSMFFIYYVSEALSEKTRKLYKFVDIFGQSSYYIYLMHPFLLSAMISIIGDYTSFTVTQKLISYFLVVIPGSSVLCIGYTMIKNKIKETKKDTVPVSNQ